MNNIDRIMNELENLLNVGVGEDSQRKIDIIKGKINAYIEGNGIVDTTKKMIKNFITLVEKNEDAEVIGSMLVDIEALLSKNHYLREAEETKKTPPDTTRLGAGNSKHRNFLKVDPK